VSTANGQAAQCTIDDGIRFVPANALHFGDSTKRWPTMPYLINSM